MPFDAEGNLIPEKNGGEHQKNQEKDNPPCRDSFPEWEAIANAEEVTEDLINSYLLCLVKYDEFRPSVGRLLVQWYDTLQQHAQARGDEFLDIDEAYVKQLLRVSKNKPTEVRPSEQIEMDELESH